uniref:Somatostatin domain-containing protein n=1 Tax=Steinernema glaseri TaxID=37863 RepID=A0A1I7ZCT0_9BILA
MTVSRVESVWSTLRASRSLSSRRLPFRGDMALRFLLLLVLVGTLTTVVEARPPSDLLILQNLLDDAQKDLDNDLDTLELVLERLQRNRRQTTEGLSAAELRNAKRTRCFWNPISC